MGAVTDPLGDGISAVSLIDSMGDDLRVVNAARVSMAKESEWEWEFVETGGWDGGFDQRKKLSEKDARLIRYLAKHNHWTPFSHVMVTLRIKMPIFVARQWYKHQVGFTRNEVSRRYVDDHPDFYVPNEWRLRAENVKQGSSDETRPVNKASLEKFYSECSINYFMMLDALEIAPEQARMVLPQAMYTEFYETASLAGYARLCRQRLDPHAQWETRQYAKAVSDIMGTIAPVSWQELMDLPDGSDDEYRGG